MHNVQVCIFVSYACETVQSLLTHSSTLEKQKEANNKYTTQKLAFKHPRDTNYTNLCIDIFLFLCANLILGLLAEDAGSFLTSVHYVSPTKTVNGCCITCVRDHFAGFSVFQSDRFRTLW